MKKAFFSTMIRDAGLVAAGAVLGLAALLLVYLLPTEPMRQHVYWSLEMIEKEFTDEVLVDGFPATLTGNFTDCIMLGHAIYSSKDHSILEQALNMYRGESCAEEDGWWPGYSLKDYLEWIPQPQEAKYPRYWHGYLVVLKPLLLLTSVNTIRLLNSAVQLVLAGYVMISFCRKKAYLLAKAFLISLPFMFFVSTYASLSLSICYYNMVIALLIQMKYDEYFDRKNRYGEFFLITGMATAYFDFLTYPVITLIYTLCVYIYFHGRGVSESIGRMLNYSVRWFCGYVGLWASKWLLTDLLTDSSVIKDAVGTLLTRTDSAEGYSRIEGFVTVVMNNLQVYGNWCYVILAAVMLVMLIMLIMKKSDGGQKADLLSGKKYKMSIPYVLLALYPFIWFFVAQNHSEEHWQFTCRILAGSVFAVTAGCAKVFGGTEEREPCK